MTRGVKVRLIAFVVLAAVGVVYVAANYLGLVDRVLGRGYTVHVTLPASGGLYVGSEVDYRGVTVGRVSRLSVIPDGVEVTLSMDQDTRIPLDSKIKVGNLSAVGEQYLNFVPPSASGPFARDGATFRGDAKSLPVSTEQLLVHLNSFVRSVNDKQLHDVVQELGTMFAGTAQPLRRLVDSGARFVRAASRHQDATIRLLDSSRTVLATQQRHAGDIRAFASGLAELTRTLRTSDPQLRTLLQGGPAALREVNSLLKGLEPVLPVFIGNLVTVNQVVTARLPALEQTLVAFPRVVSTGFTGTPGDGYGHLNMQFNYDTPACQQGYLPRSQWPLGTDLRDLPLYPAKCRDPRAQPGYTGKTPINQRGVNFMPGLGASTDTPFRAAPYDAGTGVARTKDGHQVKVRVQGGLDTVFGDRAWQWMLIGPVAGD